MQLRPRSMAGLCTASVVAALLAAHVAIAWAQPSAGDDVTRIGATAQKGQPPNSSVGQRATSGKFTSRRTGRGHSTARGKAAATYGPNCVQVIDANGLVSARCH
jgi:hypothetical protein